MKNFRYIWGLVLCFVNCGPFTPIDPVPPVVPSYALLLISDNVQIGDTDTRLPDEVVVRVEDQDGKAVKNAQISIRVLSGNGLILSSNPTMTDMSGLVRIQWQLGPTVGTQSIEITGISFPNPAMLTVTATARKACPEQIEYENEYYQTVLIEGEIDGSHIRQCWLARNLNVGTMVTVSEAVTTGEKHCYDDLEDHCRTYGGFYSWREALKVNEPANTHGICPEGWHVPSDDEWKKLEQLAGIPESQLDSIDFRGAAETDKAVKLGGKFGLDILLGGEIENDPRRLENLHQGGIYASSTFIDSAEDQIWARYFSDVSPGIKRFESSLFEEGQIRCIQD